MPLELKNVDKSVGGGVDRDKLPASDFAGKNRSFPIVTAKDVKDALSSIGRAGSNNYSAAKLKANILRIAKRKDLPIPKSDSEKAAAIRAPFCAQITDLSAAVDGQARTSWIWFCAANPDLYDPRYGEFAITPADLATMLSNFQTKFPVAPTRLAVDYNHGSSRPSSAEEGKAAGWVVDLELRGDGTELWAKVEWTDEAATRIEAKEYQYISPTFSFEYTTSTGAEAIGPTLLAGALTNRPVIHGQPAVSLAQADARLYLADAAPESSDDETAEQLFSFDDQKRRIYQALKDEAPECPNCGLSSDAPDYYSGPQLADVFDDYVILRCWCGALSQLNYQIADDGEITFDGEPFEVRVSYEPLTGADEEQDMSQQTIKVKDVKGHEFELAQETVLALAKAHAPTEAVELAALKQTVETQGATILGLQAQNDALALAARTQKADLSVAALVKAGKLDPKDRQAWFDLALQDEARFTALAATLTAKREIGVVTGSNDDSASDVETRFNAKVDEIAAANPKLTQHQAYDMAMQRHPALYRELDRAYMASAR